jgi:choline kinase
MKVCVEDGRLVEMSKRLPSTRTSGENLGILHLTEEVARSAFGVAGALLRRGGAKDWLGAAINSLVRRRPIGCVDVAGLPWVEIDFPHDLSAARRRVWPAIEALSGASGRPVPRGVRRLPAPVVAPEVSAA